MLPGVGRSLPAQVPFRPRALELEPPSRCLDVRWRRRPEGRECVFRPTQAPPSLVSVHRKATACISAQAYGVANETARGPGTWKELDTMNSVHAEQSGLPLGTRDGEGAGDHDQPYRFGRRPCSENPFPFNTRQYVRLLVLRGRLREENAEWMT